MLGKDSKKNIQFPVQKQGTPSVVVLEDFFNEEFIREDIKNLKNEYYFKGEITVVISNKQEDKKNLNIISESDKIKINKLINKMSVKNIVETFSKKANVSKSTIYNYCLRIKNEK